MFNRKFALFLCVVVLMIVCVACQPGPAPAPQVYSAQNPDTIHLEGDSVTFNTYYLTGIQKFSTSGDGWPGASVSKAGWGSDGPATQRVPRMLSERKVGTLVWAYGINEIAQDPSRQWTFANELYWIDLLVNRTPDTSCVVIVKPWVLQNALPITSMYNLRVFIDRIDRENANIVTVDWKPVVESNPHFLNVDGVHIEPGTGGPEARHALMQQGVSSCES